MEKSKWYLYLLAAVVLFSMSGCMTWSSLIEKIPNAEFKNFAYHRVGTFTSADIIARGCEIDDDELVIDYLSITANYHIFGVNVTLEGYRRKINRNINEKESN